VRSGRVCVSAARACVVCLHRTHLHALERHFMSLRAMYA
jgi:hypothetical protein